MEVNVKTENAHNLSERMALAAPEAFDMLKTILGVEHGKPKPNKARIWRIQAILEKTGVFDE